MKIPAGQTTPSYESVNRILGKIAEFSKAAADNAAGGPQPKFYLVVDEINRANLATVFGELIYGLEYRNSKVSTPYEVKNNVTGDITKDIVLGKNLFILGTMNTADKSIDAIDYAIRRRFIFIDIYHDENLTAKIRGKIDVSKNIKHNTARGRSDKFYCSYVDFTDDNIENRIVKAALLKSKKILKEKFSSEASVNGKINFCLNSLRHVKVTNISNTDINSSNVGGLYSYYKPAIQQARAILSLNFQSHNEKNGENEKGFVYTIPYTINMETLFEYYARTELKKALKGSEYRVEQYSKKLYLQKDIDNVDDAEKGIHLMSFCIPDIIIYKEDKPVVVIDAKYKLSGRPDRSDSHQLLSYVLLTGADRCGFVLPGEKTEVKEMVSTGDNYLPLAPRILRYYELLLGSKSDSSELQKVLQ